MAALSGIRFILIVYFLVICWPNGAHGETPPYLDFEPIKQLADYPPVILVRFADGTKKVLRFTSNSTNAFYEKFVATFLLQKYSLFTSEISVLGKQQTLKILKKLNETHSKKYGLTHLNDGVWVAATVATFFEGYTLGADYLLSLNGNQDPYTVPTDTNTAYIPNEIRNQLFDVWALLTVLGVDDFHSRNWLILDSGFQIVPIDLGMRSTAFSYGWRDPFLFAGRSHHPFSSRPAQDLKISFLQSHISEKMRDLLSSMSTVDILSVAHQSGYSISIKQVVGIKRRAAYLANGKSLNCDWLLEKIVAAEPK